VPSGSYLLQIGSSYFWTSATNVDNGHQVQGRPNPTPSSTGETIAFDVALTVPIQFTDRFELVDPNTAEGYFSYVPSSASGNTYNQTFFWPNDLIDASAGDKAYLSHLRQTGLTLDSSHQVLYSTQAQEEMTPALSIQMVAGVTTNVSGSMAQGVPGIFRANFKLSAFAALSSQMAGVGLSASTGSMFAGLAAVPPFAVAGGFPGDIPSTSYPVATLVAYDLEPSSANPPDLDLGSYAYNNGFPQNYTTVLFVDWGFAESYSLAGAFPTSLPATIKMNSLSSPMSTQPVAPVLGPVTALRLDGTDIFNTQQTGISLAPTITWKAPSLGTANFYQIDVVQLTVEHCSMCPHPDYTVTTNVATFQTQQTSLTLPTGLLAPGSNYVVTVTAKNAVASNLDAAPLRTTYPFAYTDALSQMFTTSGTSMGIVAETKRSYGPLARNRKDLSPRTH
jgi:hypothetical protein